MKELSNPKRGSVEERSDDFLRFGIYARGKERAAGAAAQYSFTSGFDAAARQTRHCRRERRRGPLWGELR